MYDLIVVLRFIFGLYIGLWVFPYMFFYIRTAYGDSKHIIFLDAQLSKDPKKALPVDFMNAGSRFQSYCFMYPFIQKRTTTKSRKFRVIMWLNSLWDYSVVFFMLSIFLLTLF
jgi:hypothetical protein